MDSVRKEAVSLMFEVRKQLNAFREGSVNPSSLGSLNSAISRLIEIDSMTRLLSDRDRSLVQFIAPEVARRARFKLKVRSLSAKPKKNPRRV